MARDWGPPIPAAPFIAVIRAAIERLAAIDTLREEGSQEVPAQQILAEQLGINERTVYRYKNGLDGESKPGVTTYARYPVEDALEALGIPFADVYPEIAAADDVELEPEAYCAQCRDDVIPLDGSCPWCDGPVGQRKPRSIPRRGQGRRLSDAQVRAAHRLHWEEGLSLRELGRRLYRQAGYSSAKSCAGALSNAFAGMALPARDRIDATVVASTSHGLSPRVPRTLGEREAKLAHRRTLAQAGREPCSAVTGHGFPCQNFCPSGMRTCRFHSPEGLATAAESLRRARSFQSRPPLLDEQLVREAVWMYTRVALSAEEIARHLQPRTRSSSVSVVGRAVRDALRRAGVYRGYRRPRKAHGRYARHPLAVERVAA